MSRPVALVTGASSGIGAAFATQLAPTHDVVLVARRVERLESLAAELASAVPQGRFHTVVADLAGPAGVDTVVSELVDRQLTVDLLVNNAGAGAHGSFVDLEAARLHDETYLDCVTVVTLTRALVPGMVRRRHGAVLNVASTAAFQPVPTMATYGASKAFVLSFSQALRYELRRTGVKVTVLCPGAVQTEFFSASGETFLTRGRASAAEVARAGLDAVQRDKAVVVPGLGNRLGTLGHRLAPRSLLTAGSAWLVRRQP